MTDGECSFILFSEKEEKKNEELGHDNNKDDADDSFAVCRFLAPPELINLPPLSSTKSETTQKYHRMDFDCIAIRCSSKWS